MTRHEDPIIDAFLVDGEYENIDAWMEDSDFERNVDNDGWLFEGQPIEATDAIAGAIEASGFRL